MGVVDRGRPQSIPVLLGRVCRGRARSRGDFDPAIDDTDFDWLPQFTASAAVSVLRDHADRRPAFRVPRRSKRRLASGSRIRRRPKKSCASGAAARSPGWTTWPENRHMITADGQSFIAFRKHAGVAIALGDPVGPPDAIAPAIDDFIALCDRAALVPVLLLLHPRHHLGHRRAGLAECAGRRGQPDRPAAAGVQGQEVAGHPDRAEPGRQGGRHVPDGHARRRAVVAGPAGGGAVPGVAGGQGTPRDGLHPGRCRRGAGP